MVRHDIVCCCGRCRPSQPNKVDAWRNFERNCWSQACSWFLPRLHLLLHIFLWCHLVLGFRSWLRLHISIILIDFAISKFPQDPRDFSLALAYTVPRHLCYSGAASIAPSGSTCIAVAVTVFTLCNFRIFLSGIACKYEACIYMSGKPPLDVCPNSLSLLRTFLSRLSGDNVGFLGLLEQFSTTVARAMGHATLHILGLPWYQVHPSTAL